MNSKTLRADFLLLLTAAVWGFGFVAQRSGMEHTGPFAFNGVRFILGALSLLPLILLRRRRAGRAHLAQPSFRRLSAASAAAGSVLFTAVVLQQFGILFTTAGNAGFITGLYVVFTPFLGMFLGRRTGLPTWIGACFTLAGLYFISAAGQPSVNPGDVIVIISAVFWSAHVLLIDRLMHSDFNRAETDKEADASGCEKDDSDGKIDAAAQANLPIDPIELSAGQFALCGALSLVCAFAAEPHVKGIVSAIDPSLIDDGLFSWLPFPALFSSVADGTVSFPVGALVPVLYGGLCSVGVAYTLQVVAQRDAPPVHAVIVLCFEGCFAALGGVLLLGETAGARTIIGFALMLAGMMATQLDIQKKNEKPFTE
ncbi:MAG: DMT family transporter [Treponema sp.]|nr:DMT family transporter [Treponema sp.]